MDPNREAHIRLWDDKEDKFVTAPDRVLFTKDESFRAADFVEQDFDSKTDL